MADDDTKQLNTTDTQTEDVLEETPKSSEPEPIDEVESAPEEGSSEDSDSQQVHKEDQSESSEPENTDPSGGSVTDEVAQTEPVEESSESAEELITEAAQEETEEENPTEPVNETPVVDDRPGKWYVVHTYSGHENKVAAALRQRIEAEHLEDKIIDILVPTQNKIEIKGGRKTEVKEKIFPGYILVKMVLDDASWLAVRTIPGVTSFVGMGNKPTVIPDKEVATIIQYSKIEQPTFKQVFSPDDTVKIADGPFAEMIGKVDSVDSERGKVRVLVSIFGRETPVELDFLQVQKI